MITPLELAFIAAVNLFNPSVYCAVPEREIYNDAWLVTHNARAAHNGNVILPSFCEGWSGDSWYCNGLRLHESSHKALWCKGVRSEREQHRIMKIYGIPDYGRGR